MLISETLTKRSALPDALRVLVTQFPRAEWANHPNYSQLIAFWLDRHMMFRRLMTELSADADKMLDKQINPETYKKRLSRFGGMLIHELHNHHQIEDMHYFPVMAKLDTRVSAGFDLLERDHHALDGILETWTQSANAVLQSARTGHAEFETTVSGFQKTLTGFDPLLNRHLIDEEELVVPVLLKYAPTELG